LTLPVRRSHQVGSEGLAYTRAVAFKIVGAEWKCSADRAVPVLFTTQASIKAREVPHHCRFELSGSV
jgi:hypothetical protein